MVIPIVHEGVGDVEDWQEKDARGGQEQDGIDDQLRAGEPARQPVAEAKEPFPRRRQKEYRQQCVNQQIGDEPEEIGRAAGRERGCQYVSISVVAVSLKKKNTLTSKTTREPT